jgi:tetratricopeptide (TPR) repeat protein
MLVLIIFGYYQYQARLAAESAEERAREARAAAEEVFEFLIFDLRDKLAPIGRLDIVEYVQKQVDTYYRRLGTEGQDAAVLHRRGAAYDNQGDRLLVQGKLREAQKAYEDGLAIAQKLAAHDPSNTGWQRDLSISHEKTGNILQAQGKPTKALAAYQKTLAIRERLAAHDPSNAQWQSDLSWSYKQNAQVLFELNRSGEAIAIAKRWVAHEHRRVEKSNDAQTKESLADAYLGLAWYELFNRRPKEAIDAGRKGLEANPGELLVNTINTNLAHGYLFDGQYAKAQAIYLKYKAQKVTDGRSFKQAVLDDFKELRKRGIDHPDMKRVERLLR